jgi:cytochrome P450
VVESATASPFDPFMAGTDAYPYAGYALLREEMPVYPERRYGFFAISRYEDVQAISRDWRRFSSADGIDLDRTGDCFGPNFVSCDPPTHRFIRSAIQHRFSPKAIRETLDRIVRAEVAKLLEPVVGSAEVDLARDFCWPLPFSVACHLLGFPLADREFLWNASQRFEERLAGQPFPPASAQEAARALRDYVADLADERRRSPRDDLISLLISAEIDGERLPDEQVVGNVFVLFNAGTQTTACLLTSALVLLDAHPEQGAWLVDNSDQIPRAVEEFLRFESPIQHFTRTSTEEVELHGTRIPAGSKVVLLYGAANRDPRAWTDPEHLDLAREPRRHMAFGDGIHHCLGAPIARMEACIALKALLPHLTNFRLTDNPTRLASHQLRGYVSVPAALD